jgi:hypothetical protein
MFNQSKKILIFLLVMLFASLNCIVFAADKLKLVYFSANWNYTSRKGEVVVKEAVKSLDNIEFKLIDIDAISTPSESGKLNLPVPNKIPYYVLLTPKNEIIMQNPYNGETSEQIKQILQNSISK